MQKVLIVIDYQMDFVTGPLAFPRSAALEEEIVYLIKKYEAEGDEVIFTKTVHDHDYMITESSKFDPTPSCVRGSGGEEFYGKVKEYASNHPVFEKCTHGSAKLFDFLRGRPFSEIAFCGIGAATGVLANAVLAKAACPNIHVKVYRSATLSASDEALEAAFKTMFKLHIAVE